MNSFNETRYLLTKYGEDKDIALLLGGENNLSQRFELDDFQYKWFDELSYLIPARFGADQPIQCHSNSLTRLNYGTIIYKKTAAAFAMLQSHLGEVAFDKAMQLYFDQWKFRHPAPEDLQLCLEKSTGEDLSWFFGDWIQTTKRNDLALVKASADKGLTVKNVGDLPSSAKISAMQGDSVLAVVDRAPHRARRPHHRGRACRVGRGQVGSGRGPRHPGLRQEQQRPPGLGPVQGHGAPATSHVDPLGRSRQDPCVLVAGVGVECAQRTHGGRDPAQHGPASTRFHVPMDPVVLGA